MLDPENPRFSHLRALQGRRVPTEQQMMDEIGHDTEIRTLMKAIKHSGVRDPIWVKEMGGGRYLVVEGNRRTYILRTLLEEGAVPPPGVSYDFVKANVYPPETTAAELLLQRVALQAGKKPWGPFNESRATYELRFVHNKEEEDIATDLQISITEVRKRIHNVELMIDYVKATGDTDATHFTFFNDAPGKVMEWIDGSEGNKETYFKLISPKNHFQKIRSAATKGGLRDFQKLLAHPHALKEFIEDDELTCEEAVKNLEEADVTEEIKVLKRLGSIATTLNGLTDDQYEKIASEESIIKNLRRLKRACENVLTKLGLEKDG